MSPVRLASWNPAIDRREVVAIGEMTATDVTEDPSEVRIRVVDPRGESILWWSIEDLPDGPPVNRAACAAIALLPLAQFRGWDLRLNGTLPQDLVGHLTESIDYWAMLRPDIFSAVSIDCEGLADPSAANPGEPGVLAYSGGVDSTHTLIHHRLADDPRNRSISRAIYIHGLDLPLTQASGLEAADVSARAICDAWGVAFSSVATNWRQDFSPNYSMSFMSGIAATLRLFSGSAHRGEVSADSSYVFHPKPWGTHPSSNWLLGDAEFPFVSRGFGWTRLEKVAFIAHSQEVREHVRVCWEGQNAGSNCGVCEKCVRTSLQFRSVGNWDVPALGDLSVDLIERMTVRRPGQLIYLQELLDEPGMLTTDLLDAVARVVERSLETIGPDSPMAITSTVGR